MAHTGIKNPFFRVKLSYIALGAFIGLNGLIQAAPAPKSPIKIVFDIDDVLIKRSMGTPQKAKAFLSVAYHADKPFTLVGNFARWLLFQGGRAKIAQLESTNGTHAIIDGIMEANPTLNQNTIYNGKSTPIDQAVKDIVATGSKIPEMYQLVEDLKAHQYDVMYATNQGKEVTEHNMNLGTLPQVHVSLHPFNDNGSWIKKPNPRYYERLAQQSPEHTKIIVIDDKKKNITAANKADSRIVGIVYKNPEQVKAELRKQGIILP